MSDIVLSKPNLPASYTCDYQMRFNQEKLRFISSKLWENMAKDFMRDIKQQIADGDVEELKKFLRLKRNDAFEKFNSNGVCFIWNKCFVKETNQFDTGKFMEKMLSISDNEIDTQDLNNLFSYLCMTENIDFLLSSVFALEKQNRVSVNEFFIQNLVYNNGTITVAPVGRTEEDAKEKEDEILRNVIFSNKLFDTNEKLHELRNEIGRSIDQDDYNQVFGDLERNRIDPTMQSEWYYILKAIEESGVASKRIKVGDFIEQMIAWYSWLFESFQSLEAKNKFVRNMGKSISHEKGLWKFGAGKEMTPIKDMWAKWKSLGLDIAKVSRVQPIVKALYDGLTNLKSKMDKEYHSKFR